MEQHVFRLFEQTKRYPSRTDEQEPQKNIAPDAAASNPMSASKTLKDTVSSSAHDTSRRSLQASPADEQRAENVPQGDVVGADDTECACGESPRPQSEQNTDTTGSGEGQESTADGGDMNENGSVASAATDITEGSCSHATPAEHEDETAPSAARQPREHPYRSFITQPSQRSLQTLGMDTYIHTYIHT